MEPDPRVEELLAGRVHETARERQQVLERYASRDWESLAPVEQTVRRLEYLQEADMAATYAGGAEASEIRSASADAAVMDEPVPRPTSDLGEIVFEKIIGHSEVMPIRFVHTGSRVARSIGRIVSRLGRRPIGTGFLVSPRLLLTNFHVLRSRADARADLVQFNYVARSDGSSDAPLEFEFQPDVLFLGSPVEDLDCSLVAVEPVNRQGVELSQFGWATLVGLVGKEHPGERVNVIHHPGGATKQVSLRENFVALILDRHLHYMTDTAPGSSGSPVFNDEWEVVALHHAGREITDRDEVALYRKALGSSHPAGTHEGEATVIVNEGVRISQIVEWLGAAVISGPHYGQI